MATAATIAQRPVECNIDGVAGDPFTATVTVTSAATIAAHDVEVRGSTASAVDATFAPTVTVDGDEVSIVWSAEQTSVMLSRMRFWTLVVTVNGDGPFALVAGYVLMHPRGAPGVSSLTAAALAVTVGETAIDLAVTVGATGGVIDGGTAGSVFGGIDTIDGGDA